MIPAIRYYALFEDVTEGKTAKYAITRQAGYYEPMEKIKGKDGKVSVFLLESASSGSGSNAPAMRLMAKASLNLTGLKEYFVDGGKLSGYAYGYPLATPTYGKEKKPNPFYRYREDGFLFIVHQGQGLQRPHYIEMVVLEDAKCLIPAYCKMLQMGGFEEELAKIRKVAEAG